MDPHALPFCELSFSLHLSLSQAPLPFLPASSCFDFFKFFYCFFFFILFFLKLIFIFSGMYSEREGLLTKSTSSGDPFPSISLPPPPSLLRPPLPNLSPSPSLPLHPSRPPSPPPHHLPKTRQARKKGLPPSPFSPYPPSP